MYPIQPFFTGTCKPASELIAGDKVLCRDNHWEVPVKDPYSVGVRYVYNLHGSPSEDYHASYYVGRSQLLVHNAKKCGIPFPFLSTKLILPLQVMQPKKRSKN
jgi:hypothetical protein